MASAKKILIVLAALALARNAGAALYSLEGGLEGLAGKGYGGSELWTSGSMRLAGGWYPLGSLNLSRDTRYDWIAAPALGLQKGFAGIGKFRLDYMRSMGQRVDGQDGGAGTLELGASRALSLRSSADLSYRWTHGNLFSGGIQELDLATGQSRFLLPSADYHELSAGAGVSLLSWERPLRLGAGLTAGNGSSGLAFYTESLSVSCPVWNGVSADAATTFLQSNRAPSAVFYSLGFSYRLAGRY